MWLLRYSRKLTWCTKDEDNILLIYNAKMVRDAKFVSPNIIPQIFFLVLFIKQDHFSFFSDKQPGASSTKGR